VCRPLSIWTISFERNDLWPTYLACWYILSLSRSCSTVKVIRKSSRSHDEITAPTTVASAVHTVNVYTGSPLWRTRLNYGRNVHWLSAVLKWSVRPRVGLFQFTLWTGSFANTVRLLVWCMLYDIVCYLRCGDRLHDATRCELRAASCDVIVSNRLFGDPCLLTPKYLEVQYRCETGKQLLRLKTVAQHRCPSKLSS